MPQKPKLSINTYATTRVTFTVAGLPIDLSIASAVAAIDARLKKMASAESCQDSTCGLDAPYRIINVYYRTVGQAETLDADIRDIIIEELGKLQ